MKADDLGVVDPALSCAKEIEQQCPDVVFTRGAATREDQARAMAENESVKPGWIRDTYADSAPKRTILAWLAANPDARGSLTQIEAGILSVLNMLSDEDFALISLHGSRRAFDIKPFTCSARVLSEIVTRYGGRILWSEGSKENGTSLVRWHVDFHGTGAACFCHA